MKKGIYADNGVVLSKSVLRAGDEVELAYTGLLKNCGAGEIKAHIGYNATWEDAATLDMLSLNDAFVVGLTLKKAGTLNCAFVDLLGNWDNNSGANYSFKVANSQRVSQEKKEAKKTAVKAAAKADKAPKAAKIDRAAKIDKSAKIEEVVKTEKGQFANDKNR